MEGRWEEGQGEDLDALFDPQFACSEEDFKFCKGYGKSGDSYEHGKHAAAYRLVNRMAEEADGKDEGKEQPAAAQASQPFGGKGQFVLERRWLAFQSNFLCLKEGDTWYYCTHTCLSFEAGERKDLARR